ncbi:hypothetical protein [Flexistipes sp.]|uniref:hypothetical protein n=1 Tax=Flexistipes sp. TaxID=3088135 RepID=UPI002E20A495|nr:hypothetical protein [Flexistipes sp.]
MKVICTNCGTDFDSGNKNKFECSHCGQFYNLKEKPDTYDVKMLNGVLVEKISFNELKNGLKTGKYLKYDYISGGSLPWMKITNSDFEDFVPDSTTVKGGKGALKSWIVLFVFSFIVNMVLLFFLYLQKVKIDDLISG